MKSDLILSKIKTELRTVAYYQGYLDSKDNRLALDVREYIEEVKKTDPDSLREKVSYLYWKNRLSTHCLCMAMDTSKEKFKEWIIPEKTKFSCDSCKEPLYAPCKEPYIENVYFDHINRCFCVDCWNERIKVFKAMPYDQYLQTPEWQHKRERALEIADHRCQVCNTNEERLHVHHRTYERRGNEEYSDLIVLCENCHELFHGKLAKE